MPARLLNRRQAAAILYSALYKDAFNIYRKPQLYTERFKDGALGEIQAQWWESLVDRVQYRPPSTPQG